MMSKKLYIGIYAASFGFFLSVLLIVSVMFIYGLMNHDNYWVDMSITSALRFGIAAYIQFMLVHAVLNFLLLARMWSAIQDGQTEITVGKAIGYLFIPLFNVYWIFKAWGSFPIEYDRYVDRYALVVPPFSGGVFLTYPIVLLLTAIFSVPLVILPFIFLAVIAQTCDAVNALSGAVDARRNEMMLNRIQNQYPAGIEQM